MSCCLPSGIPKDCVTLLPFLASFLNVTLAFLFLGMDVTKTAIESTSYLLLFSSGKATDFQTIKKVTLISNPALQAYS
jgi:hypothetical protein